MTACISGVSKIVHRFIPVICEPWTFVVYLLHQSNLHYYIYTNVLVSTLSSRLFAFHKSSTYGTEGIFVEIFGWFGEGVGQKCPTLKVEISV